MRIALSLLWLAGVASAQQTITVPEDRPDPAQEAAAFRRLQLHDAARLRELAWRNYSLELRVEEAERRQRENAATLASLQAEVSVRQRHIWIDRRGFEIQLKNAVANVMEIGDAMVRQLRASHDLLLPNLDSDAGKLQAEVVRLLRREGLWTRDLQQAATTALASQEEASVFGLVQFLTGDFARSASLADRVSRERVAGKLMALAS